MVAAKPPAAAHPSPKTCSGEPTSPPTSEDARWALREMYNTLPTLWTLQGLKEPEATCFSKDGSRAAIINTHGTLAVYETAKGTEVFRKDALGDFPTCICFLADSTACLIGFARSKPIVVPLDVQAQTSTLADGAHAKVGSTALAASPDGSLLALAGTDRIIRLFDAKTLTLNLSWKPHDEPTSALAFNADATLLATGPRLLGNGTLARVWDTRSGAMLYSYSRSETANIFSMVFTGDNASLLVASLDRRLYRCDLKPDALPVVMHEFSSYFTAACEGPMGLALTDSDGVHVLERGQQTPRRVLASLRTPGLSAAWTNADTIGVVCQDGTLRAVNAHPSPAITNIAGFSTWCFGVSFSRDGSLIAIAPGTGGGHDQPEVVRRDNVEDRIAVSISDDNTRSRCVRFLPDSRTIVLGSSDGKIRLADAETGIVNTIMGDQKSEVYSLDANRHGTLAAAGYANGLLQVWNLETLSLVASFAKHYHRVEDVAFSPDGNTLASSGMTGAVNLWNPTSGELLARLATSADAWGVAFSPDAKVLLASNYDGSVDVFDLATRTRTRTFQAHGRLVPGVCFAPDGNTFATGSTDGAIKLWDSHTCTELLAIHPEGEVVEVAFDPTGRYLAGTCSKGLVCLYDLLAMDPYIDGNQDYQRARFNAVQND